MEYSEESRLTGTDPIAVKPGLEGCVQNLPERWIRHALAKITGINLQQNFQSRNRGKG